jgi:hypothetical protein
MGAAVSLTRKTNLDDPDGFYAALLAAHRGLTPEQSEALSARLILILANHVGEMKTLREAIDLAKE